MELYELTEWSDVDQTRTTIGVFDSREKAEKAADWMNKNVSNCYVSFEIGMVPLILNKIDNAILEYYGLLGEEWAQA